MIVLAFLFPLFQGLANNYALYARDNLLNLLEAVIVVAILAFVASSIPLVRRPGTA